jgi:uncharacterized membrane protein YdbT with pleckstrin-like domain
MIGTWAATGLGTAVVLAALIVFWPPGPWWLALLGGVLIVWLVELCALAYWRISDSYVLTAQRLVHESGILSRTTDRIELLDIDDVTVKQGLIERFLGVGTIHILSSDRTSPKLDLIGIENAKETAAIFDDARLAERRRRGLHIEQI